MTYEPTMNRPATDSLDPQLLGPRADELVLRPTGGVNSSSNVRISSAKCTIGSSPRCTLRIRDAGLRPYHCLILRGARDTVVRRWSPDTLLNGRTFTDAPLRSGDRLRCGSIEFEVLGLAAPSASDPDAVRPLGPSSGSPPSVTDQLRADLEKTDAELTSRKLDIQRQRERARSILNHLRDTRSREAEVNGVVNEQQEQIARSNETLAARASELVRERSDWEHRQEQFQQQAASLEDTCGDLRGQVDLLQSELNNRESDLGTERSEWERRQQEYQQQTASLEDACADLRRHIATLQTELANQGKIAEARENSDDMHMRDELRAEHESLLRQRERLEQDRIDRDREQSEWEKQRASDQSEAEREIEFARQRQEEVEQQTNRGRLELEHLEARKREIEDAQQAKFEEDESEITQQREELEREREALRVEREAWRHSVAHAFPQRTEPTAADDARADTGEVLPSHDSGVSRYDSVASSYASDLSESEAFEPGPLHESPSSEDLSVPSTPGLGNEPSSLTAWIPSNSVSRPSSAGPSGQVSDAPPADDIGRPNLDWERQDGPTPIDEANSLPAEEPAAATITETETPQVTPTRPHDDVDSPNESKNHEKLPSDDETSIEEYMANLLTRVRGHSTQCQYVAEARPSKKPAAAPAGAPARVASDEPEPAGHQEKFNKTVARAKPPEQSTNMAALRELANEFADRAIDKHSHRRFLFTAIGKLIVAVAGAVTSVVLFAIPLTNTVQNPTFDLLGGGLAGVIALVWGYQGAGLLRDVLRQKVDAEHE